ncbi:MAG: hypothetical protein JOZ74_05295 [Bradyrhizobium sp.]|nr:hypothetical protein [Bradyrhizobium sp.]
MAAIHSSKSRSGAGARPPFVLSECGPTVGAAHGLRVRNRAAPCRVARAELLEEDNMDFTKGALLWLLGVPLPIILLIALFWHH